MSVLDLAAEPDQLKAEMRHYAESIIQMLDKDDLSSAVNAMQLVNENHFDELYQEVGKLTREVHDSIRNFNVDESKDSEIENASDHLAYIIKMTEEAANKTMDSIESALPIAEQNVKHAEEIHDQWTKFLKKEMDASEFRKLCKVISGFLKRSSDDAKQINNHLNEVLMAQGFQDLTGQAIQKVTALIKDIEQQLVKLVAMASDIDKMTGIKHEQEVQAEAAPESANIRAEGPQIDPTAEGVVSDQNDVDDLLSSLGF